MRRISRLLFTGWLSGLVLVTSQRLPVWRSNVALWSASSKSDPGLLRPWVNLAVVTSGPDAIWAWTKAKSVLERDEVRRFPHPVGLRRLIVVQLATLLAMRDWPDAPHVQALLVWGGCYREEPGWICPANFASSPSPVW